MFYSTFGLKINMAFGDVFELNSVEHQHLGIMWLQFAPVSIGQNQVVSLD